MKKRSGFTLIELLVVMAILGMLAALVGPALFGNLSKGQRTTAASQISNLQSALDTYRLDVGSYPDSLRGLLKMTAAASAGTGLTSGTMKCHWIPGTMPIIMKRAAGISR